MRSVLGPTTREVGRKGHSDSQTDLGVETGARTGNSNPSSRENGHPQEREMDEIGTDQEAKGDVRVLDATVGGIRRTPTVEANTRTLGVPRAPKEEVGEILRRNSALAARRKDISKKSVALRPLALPPPNHHQHANRQEIADPQAVDVALPGPGDLGIKLSN